MKKILSALPFFNQKKDTETKGEEESKHEVKFSTCLPSPSWEPDFNKWSEHIYRVINSKYPLNNN